MVGAAAGVAATLAGTESASRSPPSRATTSPAIGGPCGFAAVPPTPVETLTAAPPDGIRHAVASLAVVDLSKKAVLSDCRPTFVPLTDVRPGTCTVTAFPGDDLQAAADRLPDTGGRLCLAAGTFGLGSPVVVKGKQRIVVTGVGPATVLRMRGNEAVFEFLDSQDVVVESLRAEAGTAPTR